ncbi:MAG TPA: SAM-dependent methyltransferase, partial [Candidatus Saccharimonadia bacterium]|nr:SAM-dependent methyltransferase [Candidatus Saccharimonadia bacterium]
MKEKNKVGSSLDKVLVERGLLETRSQAESYIKLGFVLVNTKVINSPTFRVKNIDKVEVNTNKKYVSRAGFKLAFACLSFGINFNSKIVLDVGSSTGGFSDFAIQHGAKKIIAVDIGTDQMHEQLRVNPKIELHEQTDIRNFTYIKENIDIVLIDVSFISLRYILPAIYR